MWDDIIVCPRWGHSSVLLSDLNMQHSSLQYCNLTLLPSLAWVGLTWVVVGENDGCYFLIILSVCKLRSYYLIFPIWKERKVFRKAAHKTSRTLDMIYNFWKENQNHQSPLEFHVGWGEGFCLIRNYLIAFCLQLVVREIYDSFQSIRFH